MARELDNTSNDPTRRVPLILGGGDFHSVTETVCGGGGGAAWTVKVTRALLLVGVASPQVAVTLSVTERSLPVRLVGAV